MRRRFRLHKAEGVSLTTLNRATKAVRTATTKEKTRMTQDRENQTHKIRDIVKCGSHLAL
jgi:hypothetical protein